MPLQQTTLKINPAQIQHITNPSVAGMAAAVRLPPKVQPPDVHPALGSDPFLGRFRDAEFLRPSRDGGFG